MSCMNLAYTFQCFLKDDQVLEIKETVMLTRELVVKGLNSPIPSAEVSVTCVTDGSCQTH